MHTNVKFKVHEFVLEPHTLCTLTDALLILKNGRKKNRSYSAKNCNGVPVYAHPSRDKGTTFPIKFQKHDFLSTRFMSPPPDYSLTKNLPRPEYRVVEDNIM